ncbi:MAG: electron transport complex subunit RsxG [Gammaproteobacteria bacterium]|nr:electron transport complex subunit RsxG [Gammaproteobacteria bacterium]
MLQSARVLTAFALAAGPLLAGAYPATRDDIARAEKQRLVSQLNALVPAPLYDNDLIADVRTVRAPDRLGRPASLVYRARKAGRPVAAIFEATAPDGYSGPIRLLVGVKADGSVAGVRVIAHKETPGLGDRIDLNISDWILRFAGKSLTAPDPARWAVKKDGGVFDQFSGATVTPRAVVKSVKNALLYFEQNRDALFAPDAATATP